MDKFDNNIIAVVVYVFSNIVVTAYIYFMKKFNVENIVHLENDVMVFENIDNVSFHNRSKILLTIDNPDRCIPSIMFIPNNRILEKSMECFQSHKNDMENWAISYKKNPDLIDTLPIGISCKNHPLYGAIFDAAAIGQYLGGIDPRNTSPGNVTIGFINETCLVDYSKFLFVWKANRDGHFCPFVVIHNKEYPVINLHVHSKNLKQFMFDHSHV